MASDDEETLRRLLGASNSDDAGTHAELLDPEFEFLPHITGGFEGTAFRGPAALKQFIAARAEAWESLEVELTQVRQGDGVVVAVGYLLARGRASSVEVKEPTVWMARFRDGRVLRIETRPASDPAVVAQALAEMGLPRDAFDA